ncbi:MAG TPA: methyl-accepting chemotaxis protein [Solirubrobacter sp.]|nr:methyl-accepting chemotaxis protein [Solirubrobacter sp.]
MLVVLLPLVAAAVASLTFFAISRASSAEKTSRFAEMHRASEAAANDFDAEVRDHQAVGRTIAAMAESIGADAAHKGEPGSDAKGRFGPYWNKITGKVTLDPLADQESNDYWNVPKDTGKDTIVEPYLYDGALLTSFVSPVKRDGHFVGIGGVDVSLSTINGDVAKLKFLESGYGFMVSKTGIFVAAPDKRLIGNTTLGELGTAKHNPVLTRAAKDIAAGRPGQAETTDPFTGKQVVLTWAPVQGANWGFLTAVPVSEVLAPMRELRTALLLIGLVLLLASAAAIYWFARRITRPIVAVAEAAERVAEGDVDVEVHVKGHDELARLGTSFQRTVDYLRDMAGHADRIAQGDLTQEVEPRSDSDVLGVAVRDMRRRLAQLVGKVSESSRVLTSASREMASTSEEAGRAVGEIAAAVSDVAQGAERQVRAIEAVKHTTQEVGEATSSSAQSAQETASAAADARRLATEGQHAVAEATEAMRQVRESSGEVTQVMRQLAAKSEQIGGIIETITGIAGQTNLLALNAAIEAARAGEQGRGFAVVAEEVRKLAEESQRAAATIATLVEEIQAETSQAVFVVEAGAERSEQGAATVERAHEAFERIGASVEGMTARVDAIAAAVNQIAASAERVQDDMTEVAAVAEQSSASSEQVSASTQQTSASAQEIAASAQQLAGTAQELQGLVEQFSV